MNKYNKNYYFKRIVILISLMVLFVGNGDHEISAVDEFGQHYHPKLLTVQEISIKPSEEYNYIVEPLKEILEASIQTGNPVVWM